MQAYHLDISQSCGKSEIGLRVLTLESFSDSAQPGHRSNSYEWLMLPITVIRKT